MLKKFFSLLCVAMLSMAFVGCEGGKVAESTDAAADAAAGAADATAEAAADAADAAGDAADAAASN